MLLWHACRRVDEICLAAITIVTDVNGSCMMFALNGDEWNGETA